MADQVLAQGCFVMAVLRFSREPEKFLHDRCVKVGVAAFDPECTAGVLFFDQVAFLTAVIEVLPQRQAIREGPFKL